MVGNISLDKPLLEQQSVREMLPHLTEGVNAEVRVEDLIKIARAVIHDELVDCGCDKSELTGLKLSYTVTHPEDESLRKVYTTEWNFPKPEVAEGTTENAPEAGVDADSNPPISNQVTTKLLSRLEEARAGFGTAGMAVKFRNSSEQVYLDCEYNEALSGTYLRNNYYDSDGITLLRRGEWTDTICGPERQERDFAWIAPII